jgi:hypothetical protein
MTKVQYHEGRLDTRKAMNTDNGLISGKKGDITQHSSFLGYKSAADESTHKNELQRLKGANQLITILLGELHNIQELMGLNNIAKVESLEEKIKKGYKKIQQYLSQYEQDPDMELGQQAGAPQSSLPVEQHPFLEDMGGMLKPDQLDAEFLKELGINQGLDKAEVKNQAQKKMKDRIQSALKVTSKLQNRLRAQPAFKPGAKQSNELLVKYKMALKMLEKPMLKPESPQPDYTPRNTPAPTPKPSTF